MLCRGSSRGRPVAVMARGGIWSASCPRVPDLAEGEGVGVDARVNEGDLEGALADRARLADELIQARFGDGAVAPVVHVGPVGGARRLALEAHPGPHPRP